jgi:hypothetical protein
MGHYPRRLGFSSFYLVFWHITHGGALQLPRPPQHEPAGAPKNIRKPASGMHLLILLMALQTHPMALPMLLMAPLTFVTLQMIRTQVTHRSQQIQVLPSGMLWQTLCTISHQLPLGRMLRRISSRAAHKWNYTHLVRTILQVIRIQMTHRGLCKWTQPILPGGTFLQTLCTISYENSLGRAHSSHGFRTLPLALPIALQALPMTL